jgi:DNA invertase Pin-like site-specific DNA recombinase
LADSKAEERTVGVAGWVSAVSTTEQILELQRDALPKVRCEEVLVDQASGTKAERPG